ncbi:hypothetical protein [Soonwooa sp.]|uniref:hypothetical protein n=1 Tax=Soonwooa sp. TaxID=1938592 RepID=UPI0026118B78|nr:hypothetical protein [Soonwooa sp.]
MKKAQLLMVYLFPILILILFGISISNIDSQLEYVTKKTVFENSRSSQKLVIEKYAGKRRLYFFVETNQKPVQYKRDYEGILTSWIELSNNRKYENEAQLSFYTYKNENNNDKVRPFFSLNNEQKNLSYYVDIFQYLRNKYYLLLILSYLAYLYLAGRSIDRAGGIAQNKIASGVYAFSGFCAILLLLL